MDYALWILAILTGFLLGHFTKSGVETTPEEETCDYQRAQLQKDVEYYKRLTKTLVDENTEFRRKLNDRN